MLANEVIYIDIDDFVSNVETLINQGIADIRESGNLFKVYGTWYRIYSDYVKYQGMRVNLKKGIDGNNIDISLYSAWTVGGKLSESRIMAGKLYDKLHEIYIFHQLFNNTNVVKSLKKYTSIIKRCTSLEKFSDNIFILCFNNNKYCFTKKERYNSLCNNIEQYVEVDKYDKHTPSLVYKSDNIDSIQSLYSILNTVYYINKTKQGYGIDYTLACALGIAEN